MGRADHQVSIAVVYNHTAIVLFETGTVTGAAKLGIVIIDLAHTDIDLSDTDRVTGAVRPGFVVVFALTGTGHPHPTSSVFNSAYICPHEAGFDPRSAVDRHCRHCLTAYARVLQHDS